MPRALASLFGAALLLTAAPAAPVPTHLMPKTGPSYFPTRIGAESVYLHNGMEGGERWRITATEERAEGTRVTINGEHDSGTVWLVSPKGVFIVSQGKETYDPPLTILKLSQVSGTTWEVTSETKGGDRQHPKGKFAAHGPEEIAVSAGKYRAIRAEGTWDGGTKVTFWFAPEVGMVKRVVKHANGEGFTQELKSFTPGKK